MHKTMLKILAVLLCNGVCYVVGFGLNYWTFKHLISEQQQQHAVRHISQLPENVPSNTFDDEFISQRLDHFDPQNQATYNQRYWVNKLYWKRSDGPVFLYIGGEAALSSVSVQWGAYVKFAETYGALIFAVEHRFYGASINDDGLKLNNLRYLSSQQALADLAWFHKEMSGRFNLTEDNKWVSFGGSYPGALSAWFRVKYPHLVHASVASSAPVKAIVDFKGYNDVVTNSLRLGDIGGSLKCVDAVKEAFQTVDAMLNDGRRSQLERDFNLCQSIKSDYDIFSFVSNLADIVMNAVQYDNTILKRVEGLCKSMLTPGSSPYQNLVTINKKFSASFNQNCSDYSWSKYLLVFLNTTVIGNSGMRQWIYQTCSQFGYYQTCEVDTSCLFSKHMSLGPNLDICRVVFDFTIGSISKNVDFTNEYYGSIDLQGSNILFVNGLVDPWHSLSVLRNVSITELAVVIPSTSHCADMYPDEPSDPPALRTARKTISDQIGVWLRENNNPKNRTFKVENHFQIVNEQSGRRRWELRL